MSGFKQSISLLQKQIRALQQQVNDSTGLITQYSKEQATGEILSHEIAINALEWYSLNINRTFQEIRSIDKKDQKDDEQEVCPVCSNSRKVWSMPDGIYVECDVCRKRNISR
jgi:hypothetical protein